MRFFVFEVVTLIALVLNVTNMRNSAKCTVTCLQRNDIV